MWSDWVASMRANFNGFTMTEEQQRWIYQYFMKRGLNWMLHKHYNEARVSAVRNKVFPPHLLTPDERLCEEIENAPSTMTMSFETRQDLKRRIKEAQPEPVD